jgi:hypothetical protein
MRVRIEAGGRIVEIDAADTNLTPADLADKALAVWRGTEGTERASGGPAFGLTQERNPRRDEPSHMARGGHMREVQA